MYDQIKNLLSETRENTSDCNCDFFNDDGVNICTLCGRMEILLDTSVQQFNASYRTKIIKYTREGRFERLLKNLRGWQLVKDDVMEKCKCCNSVDDLRARINSLPELRQHAGKIATIWRNLGHIIEPMTPYHIKMALFEFNKIMEKKSFLVLLPYILKKIGRGDLIKFCKMPTMVIQKKYNLYL